MTLTVEQKGEETIILSILIPNQLTSEDCNLQVGYFDSSNGKLNQ